MAKRIFSLLALLGLFAGAAAPAYAELTCGSDSPVFSNAAMDFSKIPNQINTSVPINTVIYSKETVATIWCGKKLTGSNPFTEEEIFINRITTTNILGSNSGLTVYVTINGNRGTTGKNFGTGVVTNKPWTNGLDTDYLDRVTVNVTVELVKTGENLSLNPKSNNIQLFTVGTQGAGDTQYYLRNNNYLNFTIQTCDIYGDGNFSAELNPLSVNSIHAPGAIDSPTRDFDVLINCNSDLWSTQNILMKITGESISGMENLGLYKWKNVSTGEEVPDMALQLLQGASGSYEPVVPGQNFVVGNFEEGLTVVRIPLRAKYYATGVSQLTPAEVRSVLVYNIDYQ
ncbi:fimbrial protein [Enterobacteriaceae bacterium C23F]